VIILDLLMAHFDGWDFRAEQKADPRLARIPVVSFSAVGKLVDAAAVCLRKPAGIDEIVRAIESLDGGA
jgi:CheY-like chemotaxis protein